VASALGGLAALVWLPQLLGRGTEEQPPVAEIPAEAPAIDSLVRPPSEPEVLSGASDTVSNKAPASQGGGELEQLASLEHALDRLDSFAPPRGTDNHLDELLRRIEERDARDTAVPLAPDEDPRQRLAEFASRNPLTGLLRGADRSAALLGHRVVRCGDPLLGGLITVQEIGPGWVRLGSEEQSLTLELPPFEARAARLAPGPELVPSSPDAAVQPAEPAPGTAQETQQPGT